MWQLWNEYRKESRLFWMFSSFSFLLLSGFMIYKVGFQQMHFQGIAQFVLIMVFFFLFAHFIWEMYRQIKVWKKSQYRLLPISEAKFYFSNILFSWITTIFFMFCYYLCLVGLVFILDKQADMANFQEYWKHLLIASYFFFSTSIYVQFVYLLSSLISMNAPVRLQRVSKYVLFLFLFAAEVIVSDQLLNGYKKIAFIDSHQFKITVGYVPLYLEDLIFDGFLLVISCVVSIFILKKYIEAERR
ncbi:hypothetical protein UAW_00702 [Enterococcus haemoperoxidus ATCC BAA-382]|uniref:Uncharacterized protein n=1 Tax=Enterococcus haemoperoxidus ATCC BAA-382 TaxID=1158608 RepID=R2SWE7_9ENTE|nr:hypothetical protein [Enterococcus haemoperoxidus]EOH99550.1 hypothetical protein UAW_00702 [Enterococcus haemoperoxidus ATCC BAA-382]EOT62710.1 hypothetical protein I583_01711 [Enterococcus haemoperoxidus ATCC BAA-382]OJG55178.1 hypothetical protein RV06_GL002215 [Enterococcus haemoperoxidus]